MNHNQIDKDMIFEDKNSPKQKDSIRIAKYSHLSSLKLIKVKDSRANI